jgi:hypothetical protein
MKKYNFNKFLIENYVFLQKYLYCNIKHTNILEIN